MDNELMPGLAFVCLGLLVIVLSLFWGINTLVFLPGTVSASGTVTSCLPSGGPEDGCDIVVRFKTQAGQQIIFTASLDCCVGKTVPVVYHPASPQDARIFSWSVWFLLSVFIFGVGLILSGVFAMRPLDQVQSKPFDWFLLLPLILVVSPILIGVFAMRWVRSVGLVLRKLLQPQRSGP